MNTDETKLKELLKREKVLESELDAIMNPIDYNKVSMIVQAVRYKIESVKNRLREMKLPADNAMFPYTLQDY